MHERFRWTPSKTKVFLAWGLAVPFLTYQLASWSDVSLLPFSLPFVQCSTGMDLGTAFSHPPPIPFYLSTYHFRSNFPSLSPVSARSAPTSNPAPVPAAAVVSASQNRWDLRGKTREESLLRVAPKPAAGEEQE